MDDCDVVFEPHQSANGRWVSFCSKTCAKKNHARNQRAWHLAHPDKIKQYQTAYYNKHAQEKRDYSARWKRLNLDRARETKRIAAARLIAKAKAYDRIVEVGTWWAGVKVALEHRTTIPEPPMASLEDIAV